MIIKCPFCRNSKYGITDLAAKLLMSEQCPSHAKVVKNVCTGQPMVIYHTPCDAEGCYDCLNSKLCTVFA